jgi:hypothetical protein
MVSASLSLCGQRAGVRRAALDPLGELTLLAEVLRVDPKPSIHGPAAHFHDIRVGRRDKSVRLFWVYAHQDSALPARRHGHVAADQKGEAAEHLLLAQIGLAGDQLAYAIREFLVVGHTAIVRASADCAFAMTVHDVNTLSRLTGPLVAEAFSARSVVLVEGISDQRALEALAERRGRNLDAEGVSIVPMGGAQAIGSFLELFGPQGRDLKLAGLCDAGEEADFRRGLERAGLGSNLTRTDMERLGFYVCVEDLEDELVRSVGAAGVERVIAAEGELGSFRTFQKQPAKRELSYEEQLWRFMWNRKARYAALLVHSLDLDRVPRPLDGVLAHV